MKEANVKQKTDSKEEMLQLSTVWQSTTSAGISCSRVWNQPRRMFDRQQPQATLSVSLVDLSAKIEGDAYWAVGTSATRQRMRSWNRSVSKMTPLRPITMGPFEN